MKKILLFSFMLMSALVTESWAQERTVSGTVTSVEDASTMPGVNVVLKGTTNGTITDVDGNYKLSVPSEGGILIFSFVGLTTEEVEIGTRSVIDLAMTADITELSEVVVTAMGISRDKASLGYSTQELGSESVNAAKEANIVSSLSGKVAGVQVKMPNTMGGSANIIIRGNNSISGSNQPLFIIDGIPVDNTIGKDAYQSAGGYGYDFGNAASDINPDDVESINVLKGASATALYGSRASNGVVLITTKKGKKKEGLGISFSTGMTVGKINKDTFIEYQHEYGAGYGPYYGVNDPFLTDYIDVDGDGNDDLIVPTTEDASFGGKFADYTGQNVYQWNSFVPESDRYQQAYAYEAGANDPTTFFETQKMYNNSIALHGGGDNNSFRLSYTNFKMSDILPNSEQVKHTINFTGAQKISDKLSADVMFQYNNNATTGRFSTGYSDNLMSSFRQWWQVNVDIKEQEAIYQQTKRNYTWNAADAFDPTVPIYWDNPYWTRFENYTTDGRNRVMSAFNLKYDFNDWLNFKGGVTIDSYREIRETRRQQGSVASGFGVLRANETSGYQRQELNVSELNYNAMLVANKNISDDFNLAGVAGVNIRRNNFDSYRGSTAGGIAVPGVWSLDNSVSTSPFPVEVNSRKEVYGYYVNLNAGFKNMLYLDGSYRYDVSSALPLEDNAYGYYSAALSWVFSEVVQADWLNFGKVRASYGKVGNDLGANNTTDGYLRNANYVNDGIMYTLPSTKSNKELVPEEIISTEVGLAMAVLNNRINFDFSAYKTSSFNQLMRVDISSATGYSSKYVNGGEVENKGLELVLGGDIVKTKDITWNASLNWTKNLSEVISLPDGPDGEPIDNYTMASYQGGVSVNATVGQPFGVLKGTGYKYLNGEKVVNSSGYYVAEPNQIIGNPNPDYIAGLTNTVSYKGLTLSFLLDMQGGGDVYSLDMHYGQGTGLPASTAGLNDLGNPVRDPVTTGNDSGGVLNPGVDESGAVNTVRARADYYGGAFYWGNSSRNPGQMTVYDASYIKFREMSLTYNLPQNLVKSFAQRVSISVVGRNLAILSKNVPYADPESGLGAGNAQGYLTGSYPTTRTLGFKINLEF